MKKTKPTSIRLDLRLESAKTFLRTREREHITALPGFDKRKHRVPDHSTPTADAWIKRMLEDRLREETQTIYENAKKSLKLRRSAVERSVADGSGSVETPFFRFGIEVDQDPKRAAEARITRSLIVQVSTTLLSEDFDRIFPVGFREVVIPLAGDPDFDELVGKFEDYSEKTGGVLSENEDTATISYVSPEGVSLTVKLAERELIVRPNRNAGCLALIKSAEQFGGRATKALLKSET